MTFNFTPAADRAVTSAAHWRAATDDDIDAVALLHGLLEQSESRAAKQLSEARIDEEALNSFATPRKRRAGAGSSAAALRLSPEVETAIHAAILRLDENPRTCQIATEHILLGLALADGDVGAQLRARGVDPVAMEDDICKRYGIDRTPIPLDFETPPVLEEEPGGGATTSSPVASTLHGDSASIMRILDAAANRAGEALRVVEDYVRFTNNDAAATRECKQLRHDLTAALAALPLAERLAARDTIRDVGTTISTESERRRDDLRDVVTANLRRLQESLRSLEEFGKTRSAAFAAECEQLRYRSYTLQKALAAALDEPSSLRARLEQSRLYILIDGRDSPEAFRTLVETLVAAGVDILQLRDKRLDDRTLLARARLLRKLTAHSETLFIVNDRPDLARLADADGVHVGQDELDVAAARAIVGGGRLVGVSTHNIEQARQAVLDGADYLGVGPTFPSGTKSFTEFPGVDFVRQVAAEIRLPAFAIGGIDADNLAQVRAAGLDRVAVGGAVTQAPDPTVAVVKLQQALSAIRS